MSKIAFIFSGQGSQYVGMGKELYDNYLDCKNIFDKANEALDYDIKNTCFEGPAEELNVTEITQPAILTLSIAAMTALRANGIEPDVTAGFSLGEYSALVCSGVLDFEEAVKLVKKRGRFMQEAVPLGKGGMAAILGLDREKVLDCCKTAGRLGVIEAVNFNCPGQIVIAGVIDALNEAMNLAVEMGGKAIKLNVSAPFHSSLLEPAAEKLKVELEQVKVNDINIPVLTDVNADYIKNKDDVKEILVRQAMSPVYWEDIVLRMLNDGVETFVELGPGKTLSGFVKKINRKVRVFNIENEKSLNDTLEALKK